MPELRDKTPVCGKTDCRGSLSLGRDPATLIREFSSEQISRGSFTGGISIARSTVQARALELLAPDFVAQLPTTRTSSGFRNATFHAVSTEGCGAGYGTLTPFFESAFAPSKGCVGSMGDAFMSVV